jgi:hypothetical protein
MGHLVTAKSETSVAGRRVSPAFLRLEEYMLQLELIKHS